MRRAGEIAVLALASIALLATSVETADTCTDESGFGAAAIVLELEASCGSGELVLAREGDGCELTRGGAAASLLPRGVDSVSRDGSALHLGDDCDAERVAPGIYALSCYRTSGGCGGGNFPICEGTLRSVAAP
jgi:hypothetical protein